MKIKIKIYTGLSLERRHVASILPNAIVAGPIERRQIHDDIAKGVNVLGIVDGKFYQSLAVSPAELRDALRCGIRVYGSSSLGALRAVELERFGMIGCGEIFEHIRATPAFRDDKLGQLFFDQKGANATLPFIDLFFAVDALVAQKKLTKKIGDAVIAIYEDMYFEDRSWPELQRRLEHQFPKREWAPIVEAFGNTAQTQKRKDGMVLLRRIRDDIKRIARQNQKLRGRLVS